jgi:AAA15 family ATPase/GTPase
MLKNIKIKKYKRFNDLEIKNLKRINLITGANNIGKTSLLEALSFSILKDPDSIVINLHNLIKTRDPEISLRNNNFIEYIRTNYNYFEFESNISKIVFKSPDSIEYLFEVYIENRVKKYNELIKVDIFKIKENNNFVFIVDNKGSVIVLKEWYRFIQEREDEELINENIKRFDSNIEKFKIIGNEPSVKLKNKQEYIPISELGEGLKRFIFMLIAFYKVGKGGYIFIDEIENGIWYKNYDLLWDNIFYLSEIFDVQLFITTHSKELIQSFLKISKKYSEEVSLIELIEKNNKVDFIIFDKNTLEIELDNNFEVRGW